MSTGVLLLRKEWLAALVAGVVLTLLTAFIRDVRRQGGFWKWIGKGIETADKGDEFLDRHAIRVAGRRRVRLEAKTERREYKRRHAPEQMKLFRWTER